MPSLAASTETSLKVPPQRRPYALSETDTSPNCPSSWGNRERLVSKQLWTFPIQAATGCPSSNPLPTASKSQQPLIETMLRSKETNKKHAVNEVLTSLNLFQYLSLSYCETVLSHLSLSRKLPWLLLLVMISGCRLSTCRKHQAAITSTPDICKEKRGAEQAGKFRADPSSGSSPLTPLANFCVRSCPDPPSLEGREQ